MHPPLRTTLAFAAASLAILNPAAADPAIEPLVGFEVGPIPNGATIQPRAPFFLHPDGNFYGTSPDGGASGGGKLFKISLGGVVSGLPLPDGTAPLGTPVLGADGWLWGTTSAGGALNGSIASGLGTVFRMRPETGEYQTIHVFDSYAGNSPAGGLVSDGQGFLWGTNQYNNNATSSNGTIYRVNELTGVAENRLTFGSGSAPLGRVPKGELYYDGAGNLWGTTTLGGTYGNGTLFKYNISGNSLTTVAQFTGTSTVAGQLKGTPVGMALVADGNGFLWGTALAGGTGRGTIFKVETATNTATTVIEFTDDGATNKGLSPIGPLVNDGAGFLWGVTNTGANAGKGSVFKIAVATGVLTTVFQFGTLGSADVNVRCPINGLSDDGHGYLWGLATVYGSVAPSAIYKIKISNGSFTKVAEHPLGGVSYKGRTPLAGLVGNATTPWLWGTTSAGGTYNSGTLFRYNPATGAHEVAVHFTGKTGAALGTKPVGRVLIDAAGIIWGVTELGGSGDNGTVFKFDPATGAFTSVYSFVAGSGYQPRAGLVDGGDGYFWGTASGSPNGAIYRIDPTTGGYKAPYLFTSGNATDGSTPECELLPDGAGNLWGTARFGGTGNGVLFKFTPATSNYSAVVKFSGSSTNPPQGKNPSGPLVLDAEGDIWGMTTSSASSNDSTVFEYSPASSTFTNVFIGEYNTSPLKSAFVGSITKSSTGNIRFLGTETTHDYTFYSSQRAVIYEANPTTHAVTKVRSLFEGLMGSVAQVEFLPAGGLYEHSDGSLYGMTSQGGTDAKLLPAGGGMIYRVRTGPAARTQGYSSTATPFYTTFTTSGATQTLTLRGIANPNGNAITCAFEWGPTTALGNTVAATLSANSGTGYTTSIYQAALTDLPSNRIIYYRIRVNSTGAPSFGPIQAVRTGPPVGTYPTPRIAVESPVGQPLIDNVTTVNLGAHLVGRGFQQEVAVRNLGNGNPGAGELNGLTATISGANAGDFVITTPFGATTLTPTLTSTGLIITFTPGGSGVRLAKLTITSNNSGDGTFEIPLTGTGLVQPEIEVDSPASQAMESDAGIYDYGSGAVNAGIPRSFTIRNTGNLPLTGIAVTVDGINSADFAITSQPPASIADGSSATFTVTFTPSLAGPRSATLHIASVDSDENPFNIHIGGTGVIAPEIEVQADSGVLTAGASTVDFGDVNAGAALIKLVTIRNLGSATLTGIGVSVIGADAPKFHADPVATTLAAGGEITFNLSFTPAATLAYTATLRITSNDTDENPFDVTLVGNGTVGGSGIESWRDTYFHTTANAGDAADSADSDHDGFVNLLEFALGMDPTIASTPVTATSVVGGNIEFTYTRSTAAVTAGVTYQVPWSDALGGSAWNYGDTVQSVESDNGTFQIVKATIPAGTGHRFVRLEVH